MKQNRYKIIKGLIALVLIGVFAALAIPAMAQSAASIPFLTGYNLTVVQNSTNSFAGTNYYAKGYTITNSATYPYTSSICPTLVTNTAGGFGDVPLWADRDGTPPSANISVQLQGAVAGFTNVGVFNFATLPVEARSSDYPAGLFQPATAAANQFSLLVAGNGTNVVCVASNLSSTLLQGCRAIRLSSIVWTNAGATGAVAGVFLNGYKPE